MENNSNGAYNKRSMWKWLIIYLIIGGAVYAFFYYFYGNRAYNAGPAATPVLTQSPSQMPSPSPEASASIISVSISNFAFSPSNITVHKGTTVTWTNKDSVSHTITGDSGGPSSQSIGSGQTYSYTFNQTGSFSYHCSIHPTMHGSVQVIE